MKKWKVIWWGKEHIVTAPTWQRALLIVGKLYPFDPKKHM